MGNAEALNVVQPDLITGGEALAEMLTINSNLKKLDVRVCVFRYYIVCLCVSGVLIEFRKLLCHMSHQSHSYLSSLSLCLLAHV